MISGKAIGRDRDQCAGARAGIGGAAAAPRWPALASAVCAAQRESAPASRNLASTRRTCCEPAQSACTKGQNVATAPDPRAAFPHRHRPLRRLQPRLQCRGERPRVAGCNGRGRRPRCQHVQVNGISRDKHRQCRRTRRRHTRVPGEGGACSHLRFRGACHGGSPGHGDARRHVHGHAGEHGKPAPLAPCVRLRSSTAACFSTAGPSHWRMHA